MYASKMVHILLIAVIFQSCGSKPILKEKDDLIFSFSNLSEDYSLKISGNDSIFMQVRFPRPRQLYFALTDRATTDLLKKKFNEIEFEKLDSTYIQPSVHDAGEFMFYKKNNAGRSWFVYIYGNNAPPF